MERLVRKLWKAAGSSETLQVALTLTFESHGSWWALFFFFLNNLFSIYTGYAAILFSDRYLTTSASTDWPLLKTWIFLCSRRARKKKGVIFRVCAYQSVQARPSRCRWPFFGCVWFETGIKHIRDASHGSANPRRLRLAASLKNLKGATDKKKRKKRKQLAENERGERGSTPAGHL